MPLPPAVIPFAAAIARLGGRAQMLERSRKALGPFEALQRLMRERGEPEGQVLPRPGEVTETPGEEFMELRRRREVGLPTNLDPQETVPQGRHLQLGEGMKEIELDHRVGEPPERQVDHRPKIREALAKQQRQAAEELVQRIRQPREASSLDQQIIQQAPRINEANPQFVQQTFFTRAPRPDGLGDGELITNARNDRTLLVFDHPEHPVGSARIPFPSREAAQRFLEKMLETPQLSVDDLLDVEQHSFSRFRIGSPEEISRWLEGMDIMPPGSQQ